jgi:uncharacterized protein (TIGR02246 family)
MKRAFTIALIILGGLIMGACQNPDSLKLSESQLAQIKAEIKKTATEHLNSKDASTALSYYTKDAIIISNGSQYPSFESFAEEIKEFYSSLSKINLAAYDEMYVNVITSNTALFNTKFRWSCTDTNGTTTDLQGVWSALYVRQDGRWKMSFRHESFVPMKK